MADVFFIVANKRGQDSVNGIKYFPDCVTNIGHEFKADATELPVEEGVASSDHVQKRNKTFTVSGMYNKYNLYKWAGDSVDETPQARIQDAYRVLVRLYESSNRFTLVSKYDSYPNCVITNLSIPVTPETGDSLTFTAEIKQLRSSEVQEVNIVQTENVIESKKDDASSSTSVGKKKVGQTNFRKLLGFLSAEDELSPEEKQALEDLIESGAARQQAGGG